MREFFEEYNIIEDRDKEEFFKVLNSAGKMVYLRDKNEYEYIRRIIIDESGISIELYNGDILLYDEDFEILED